MKLKRRVCTTASALFLVVSTTMVMWNPNKRYWLRVDIEAALDRLSTNWSHHHKATELNPKYESFRSCLVSTDIKEVCLDNGDFGRGHRPPCPLEELSHNCPLLRILHGYDKRVTREELEFPLAFGLKMHTSPEQAEQLLRAIYRPHNIYCIHVDKKASDAVFRVMTSIASCFSNVIMTDRVNFIYSSYDSVRAELINMRCALESRVAWKYYLNLAGQEFPLRTNLEMVRILRLLKGSNDIESFPLPKDNEDRISHQFQVLNNTVVRTSQRKAPPSFRAPIRKGSQYNAFSRGFVAAVFADPTAISILRYFNDTLSPDENVWATINALPWIPGGYPFSVKHTPHNQHISRAVVWQFGDKYTCRGRYLREVCIFTRADLPWLLRQPNLFANKFLLEWDGQVLQCLEAVLDQRARSGGVVLEYSFYRTLPHVAFRNTPVVEYSQNGIQ